MDLLAAANVAARQRPDRQSFAQARQIYTYASGAIYELYTNPNFISTILLEPGETLAVESEDAFSGQIRTDDDRRDKTKIPLGNPQTGPILVEGAEPGDALAVTIHEIRPLIGQCATRTSDPKLLAEWLGTDCPHGTHVCRIEGGLIHWSDSLTIPYAPMLGCIGTAPAAGVPGGA